MSQQQQHVGIVEAPPLPSITPPSKPHSLSLSPFHSSASPSLSFSCSRRYAPLHVSLRHENEHHHREPPVSLYLHPLSTETHFDHLLSQPQTQHQALLLVWVANWCRKCIYLKPKLEKLAADYYPRLQFYSVDVNTVSHKLVARAGVTKMPTIQLWKDSKKQAEVIGGHKAYLVINEVQEMIENECPENFSAAD